MTRILFACALSLAASTAAAQSGAAPGYGTRLESELARMGIAARCASEREARHHCVWTHTGRAGSDLEAHAVYDSASDTVYVYLAHYLLLPSDHPRAATVLRRLMEINWELLVGKFEWSPRSGEVRLSATLNTDSNFDLRAFRSVLRALDRAAERFRGELGSLVAR